LGAALFFLARIFLEDIMATAQLSDVYLPTVFDPAVDEKATALNNFLASGVMVPDPKLDSMAAVGGRIGELPFFAPIDTATEPNYVDDDPSHLAVPDNIGDAKMIYRLASMHKSWSTMDLARELGLKDPLNAIVEKIGGWWATQREKRLIYSCMGILADNDANDSDDMFYSIATDSVDPITDAERISATAVLTAAQTMGDHKDNLAAIAMHSVCYTRLQIQNLIDYIPTSDSKVQIPYYLGLRVIVDDSLPAVAGSNRITYTTMLFGVGAFAYGKGNPMLPSEMERVPAAGYGGGQDIIHTRSSDIIHPVGFQFTSSSIAGASATLAELATAANWDRVYANRKNVPMAFLKTNG
jgi:hypothetical protein